MTIKWVLLLTLSSGQTTTVDMQFGKQCRANCEAYLAAPAQPGFDTVLDCECQRASVYYQNLQRAQQQQSQLPRPISARGQQQAQNNIQQQLFQRSGIVIQ